MASTPSTVALAELLPRVRDLKVTRISHLSRQRLILDLEWAGGKATATVDVVEVLAGNAGAVPRLEARERLAKVVQDVPDDLSEAEARRRGVPLWWSSEWLRAQLVEHGTFRSIAAEAGVAEQIISEWGRRHGISRKPRVDRHKADAVIETLAVDLSEGREWPSIQELAERHGVSRATVERWRATARKRADAAG